MKLIKTPEDYYNNRGCERPAIVIILVAAFIILFSCEKLDDTFCWNCVKITFTKNTIKHTLKIDYDTILKCDYSEKDAQKFEDIHTLDPDFISTCGEVIRWTETICEKTK